MSLPHTLKHLANLKWKIREKIYGQAQAGEPVVTLLFNDYPPDKTAVFITGSDQVNAFGPV